ncbi:hypothetical protein LXL04_025452 [Taraxacum kok-saghyz]
MKSKFFLCIRPPVMETDDVDYIKLQPTVGSSYSTVSSTSGRRNGDLQPRKRAADERYIRQLSVKSNTISFSGNISEGKSETHVVKDPQKSRKYTTPEANSSLSFPGEKSISLKKQSKNSNDEVSGGHESNSGVYLMVSCLFFTMFLGKFFGILCTLLLLCSVYPHRKDDKNNGQRSINMAANSPERGSTEDYKKRVIMEGLLERKSLNREGIKVFS